jgi:predicted transcriptional regulator
MEKGHKIIRRTEELPSTFVRTVPYLILREIGKIIPRPRKNISKKKLKYYSHYPSEIATKTKVTYSHCYNVINQFKEKGLVIIEKRGNRRCVSLTPKGEKVLQLLTDTIIPLKYK